MVQWTRVDLGIQEWAYLYGLSHSELETETGSAQTKRKALLSHCQQKQVFPSLSRLLYVTNPLYRCALGEHEVSAFVKSTN